MARHTTFLAVTVLVVSGGAPLVVLAQSAGDSFIVRLQLLPQPELGGGVPPEPVLPPLTINEVRIFSVEAQRATSSVRLSFRTEPQTQATVRWGLTDVFQEGEKHSLGWEREHTFSIEDLEPATTYAFLIEVRDGYGRTASYRGKFSTRKEGEITELPLPAPGAFQVRLLPGKLRVRLLWHPTDDVRARAVRVVRSTTMFPNDPWDGEIIYEGRGNTFIDEAVRPGFTYFYTAFTYGMSTDGAPLFSSGVGAWMRIPYEHESPEPEQPTTISEDITQSPPSLLEDISFPAFTPGPSPVEEIFEQLPQAKGSDAQAAQRLTIRDIIFLQGGLLLTPTAAGVVPVDGAQALTVRLPREKTPPSLKSLVLVVRENNKLAARTLTAILRLTPDGFAYEATLPPFGRAAYYPFTLYLLSYQNQRLTKIEGALSIHLASPFQSSAPYLALRNGRWDFITALGTVSALSGVGMLAASWVLGFVGWRRRRNNAIVKDNNARASGVTEAGV